MRIGLTGGIGAGKSLVASMLRERGARIIEADALARALVRPGSRVLDALVAEFGAGILGPDGGLDRRRLAQAAFGDPARLARLNAITHPPLVAAILEEMERSGGVVVVDAALLGRWDVLDAFDLVVTVRAPREVRVRRLVEAGMARADVEARIDAQDTDGEFASQADVVIDNAGTEDDLRREVERLWKRLAVETEENDAE